MTHADNHPRAVFAPDLNVICANFAKLPKKPGNLGNQGNHSKKPLSSNDLSGTHPVTQTANDWVTGVTGNAAANDANNAVTQVTQRLPKRVTEGNQKNTLSNKHLSSRLPKLPKLPEKIDNSATQRLPTAQPINDDLTLNELEAFEERAAILEYDAGFSRADAERKAKPAARAEPSPPPREREPELELNDDLPF